MALKNIVHPYHLVNAESMGASITSGIVNVLYSDNVAIQLSFTGTPTGTFSVEGSVDAANWSALSFTSVPSAEGAADTHLLNIHNIPYKQFRLKYNRISGTGTLDAWIMAKTVGG